MAEQQAKVFPTPVDWDELYPGRFLKAVDLKGKKVTLKIAGVKLEELIGDKGPQVKGLISFDRTEKQLALNKTNGICLKEMFGKKLAEWTGKRVTLFPTTYNDDDCIRIWGSPDIEADRQVAIQLPRKRPFQMTMHHMTAPSRAPNGTGKPDAPNDAASIATAKTAETLETLSGQRESVWGVYAAAGKAVPVEVEGAFDDRRAALEQAQDEEVKL
jgi:hypothetical protein